MQYKKKTVRVNGTHILWKNVNAENKKREEKQKLYTNKFYNLVQTY